MLHGGWGGRQTGWSLQGSCVSSRTGGHSRGLPWEAVEASCAQVLGAGFYRALFISHRLDVELSKPGKCSGGGADLWAAAGLSFVLPRVPGAVRLTWRWDARGRVRARPGGGPAVESTSRQRCPRSRLCAARSVRVLVPLLCCTGRCGAAMARGATGSPSSGQGPREGAITVVRRGELGARFLVSRGS